MARKKHGRKTLERAKTTDQVDIDYSLNASANLDKIGLDSEDEFHAGREAVDESVYGQRRRRGGGGDDSDDYGDHEVLGLDIEDSDDEDEEEEEYDSENDQDAVLLKQLQMGLKRNGIVGDSDDENERPLRKQKGADSGEMDDRAWGKSRGMYYNADEASDDDDAKAEEEEALRLQRLRASQMREEDFLDDFADSLGKRVEGDVAVSAASAGDVDDIDDMDHLALSSAFPLHMLPSSHTEVEVVSRDTTNLTTDDLIRVAESSIPEVVHLLAEFKERWRECQDIVGPAVGWKCQPEELSNRAKRGREYVELKYRLLSTYLTNVAFYLSLRANPPAGVNVKAHPVVESLVQLRELLEYLEERVEGRVASDEEESAADSDDDAAARKRRRKQKRRQKKIANLGNPKLRAEVQDFISRAGLTSDVEDESESEPEIQPISKPKQTKKLAPAPTKSLIKKPKSSRDISIPEADFVPLAKTKKVKTTKAKLVRGMANDFGETDALDEVDIDDKIARKRSLQFHVTRVDQAITARQNRLSRSAGGDEDIPYRDKNGKLIKPNLHGEEAPEVPERKFDAPDDLANNSDNDSENGEEEEFMEQLMREGLGSDAAGGKKRPREDDLDADLLSDGGDENLAYYNRIVGGKKSKKAERDELLRIEKEAEALANSQPYADEDEIDPRSKRPANYKILANKGLTPRRSKVQRNARVKKRVRYESAQKKLGSFKRIVKDPAESKGYAGEKTGIKTNLARSVRFAK
ncbi:hypothetical protein HDU87_005494 [Geranomyces variabilis]|uniref:Sas10 C-terminal domain-containing protein n=1 Tax=Geranomyces variabilis TaxID=109894 RepID=A0AAD5TIG6_9FUNG|nr:hypothetical protein HDU87_005494 [Geranomyces variabilis]